jgi:hypothetical protein
MANHIEAAQQFLELLGAKRCTFQTSTTIENGKIQTVCMLHGTLDEHAEELARLNGLGAVLVAVNQTDGTSHATILARPRGGS